jgi:hypothetical protein
MATTNRITKSFTLDPELDQYVSETKGERSASERVNELLRQAMLQEKYDRLESEAKEFFGAEGAERGESRAFQKAAMRTFTRD